MMDISFLRLFLSLQQHFGFDSRIGDVYHWTRIAYYGEENGVFRGECPRILTSTSQTRFKVVSWRTFPPDNCFRIALFNRSNKTLKLQLDDMDLGGPVEVGHNDLLTVRSQDQSRQIVIYPVDLKEPLTLEQEFFNRQNLPCSS